MMLTPTDPASESSTTVEGDTEPSASARTSLERIVASWERRANVRVGTFGFTDATLYASAAPDYPLKLVPFKDDPRFTAASPEQRAMTLTLGWLAYNQRTITGEECIAKPAFDLIGSSTLPGTSDGVLKQAMYQSLIDEDFHQLMHATAMHNTIKQRRVAYDAVDFPPPITCRSLRKHEDNLSEPWQRQIMLLVFALIAEITVNPYLNLLANDHEIQPINTLVAKLHSQDEYRHGHILTQVAKVIYGALDGKRRTFFIECLPKGLDAFCTHDFSTWERILERVGLADARGVVEDCKAERPGHLVRDWSGLTRLAKDLDILDRVAQLSSLST